MGVMTGAGVFVGMPDTADSVSGAPAQANESLPKAKSSGRVRFE